MNDMSAPGHCDCAAMHFDCLDIGSEARKAIAVHLCAAGALSVCRLVMQVLQPSCESASSCK